MKKFLIGIDISKEKFDVTVIKSLGEGFESEQVLYDMYNNKVCGYSAMLKKLTSLGVRCEDSLFCLETTGAYELHLCDYLYGKGYDVWRESALQIKWSMGVAKSKNDKADSGRIAQYALRHQDAAVLYAPMNETLRTLKALSQYRERLVDEKRAKEVSIKEIRATQKMNEALQWVRTNSEQSVKRLEKDIKECEERIMAVIESDEDLKRTYGQLQDHTDGTQGGIILRHCTVLCTVGEQCAQPEECVQPVKPQTEKHIDTGCNVCQEVQRGHQSLL